MTDCVRKKYGRPGDEPSFRVSEPDNEQPASPIPMRTPSYPLEMWERAMQVEPDDESSVLQEAPSWFPAIGTTEEQFLGETISSYQATSVEYPASAAGAMVPYGCFVDAYNGATSEFSDAYGETSSGFGDASPPSLSLDEPGTEVLENLAMSTFTDPITQIPHQQTGFVRDIGAAEAFDQFFAEIPSSHAEANMLMSTTHIAVGNSYGDRLGHGLPDSPTLGASTTSTELEQLAGHRASELFRYQTPHFSDYPRKYTDIY